nr:hypothetical protein [Micromonospora sp. DSM 115978]
MSGSTRITVSLPTEQVEALKKITDNVSGYVAEAVARQIRHKLLSDDLNIYERESGPFTREELVEARAKLLGTAGDAPSGTAV